MTKTVTGAAVPAAPLVAVACEGDKTTAMMARATVLRSDNMARQSGVTTMTDCLTDPFEPI